MNFLAELKRRNVFRMAGLYLVGAWLLVQVARTLLPVFDAQAQRQRRCAVNSTSECAAAEHGIHCLDSAGAWLFCD